MAAAYLITEYGGEDGYFSFQRLQTREFYIEFGSSLVIAVVLVELIAWVTRILDRHYDWQEKTALRMALQILLGIVLPALVDFTLASLYFRFFNVNILDTIYLTYAMPYIAALILLFNMYYVIYYFYLRQRGAEGTTAENAGQILRETFIVSRGTKNHVILVTKIGCFYRYADQQFLYTLEGEEFIISQSLDSLEQEVSATWFFRINRYMIVNFKTFSLFEQAGDGKLKLFLNPPLPHKMIAYVSRDRAAGFRAWVDR